MTKRELLIKDNGYYTICDSTHMAMDLWSIAKTDLVAYIQKAAQRERLRKNNLDDVIEYCHTIDQTHIIPVLEDDYLVKLDCC